MEGDREGGPLPPSNEAIGLVKSAERTVRILDVLAEARGSLTLAELQAVTGYPRSSLHALIRTLRELKWLEADESGSAFGIGPRALLCGTSYLDRDAALPDAVRSLEDLRTEIGRTTHYARLDGADIIYLATREAADTPRLFSRVGRRLPAHATALGKALLAELTAAEVDKLLPEPLATLTEHTTAGRETLHAELDKVRAQGYAVERGQSTPGTACVACVVGYRIPATDAISVTMPVEAATDEECARIAGAVRAHADTLALALRRQGIR
jgi:DNA-binding IclR family transcriptional regulator